MKFLILLTAWLGVSCGNQATYEVKGALLILRATKEKVFGRVLRDGPAVPKRDTVQLPVRNTPSKLPQPAIRFDHKGLSYREAGAYLDQRETFFHTFFTMRHIAGGDAQLIKMLGIDAEAYFDLLQQLRLPETEQLTKLLGAVANNDRLRLFFSQLRDRAVIEIEIDAGRINHKLGNRTIRNPEIVASMQKRLNATRRRAEQDITLQELWQPELQVLGWMRHGQTVSDVLREMAESFGGQAELAKRLRLSEPRLRNCMRSGLGDACNIESIIAQLRLAEDGDGLTKALIEKLEHSVAMEKAIDAGAITSIDSRNSPAAAPTLQRLQRDLRQKRIAATQEGR